MTRSPEGPPCSALRLEHAADRLGSAPAACAAASLAACRWPRPVIPRRADDRPRPGQPDRDLGRIAALAADGDGPPHNEYLEEADHLSDEISVLTAGRASPRARRPSSRRASAGGASSVSPPRPRPQAAVRALDRLARELDLGAAGRPLPPPAARATSPARSTRSRPQASPSTRPRSAGPPSTTRFRLHRRAPTTHRCSWSPAHDRRAPDDPRDRPARRAQPRRIPSIPEKRRRGAILPIVFTCCSAYVFGSAITVPGGGDYREYLVAGMFAQGMFGRGDGRRGRDGRGHPHRDRRPPAGAADLTRRRARRPGAVRARRRSCSASSCSRSAASRVGWQPHGTPLETAAAYALLVLVGVRGRLDRDTRSAWSCATPRPRRPSASPVLLPDDVPVGDLRADRGPAGPAQADRGVQPAQRGRRRDARAVPRARPARCPTSGRCSTRSSRRSAGSSC